MKKVVLSSTVVVAVIIGICMVVMYNLGGRILRESLESGLLNDTTLTQQETKSQENTRDKQDESVTGNSKDVTAKQGSNGDISGSNSNTLINDGQKSVQGSANSQNGNKGKSSGLSSGKTSSNVIPLEKIKEIEDKITFSDKVTAAAMVMKKLSPSDIAELKQLTNGGLTAEKRKEAKKIAYARFTPEEIKKIKDLYYKYMK